MPAKDFRCIVVLMDNATTPTGSSDSVDLAGYSADRIYDLQLYVENQGDKFHPLSDRLAAILEDAEQAAQNELTSYEPAPGEEDSEAAHAADELLGRLLAEIAVYEGAPANKYHGYHIAQLRDRLAAEEED